MSPLVENALVQVQTELVMDQGTIGHHQALADELVGAGAIRAEMARFTEADHGVRDLKFKRKVGCLYRYFYRTCYMMLEGAKQTVHSFLVQEKHYLLSHVSEWNNTF